MWSETQGASGYDYQDDFAETSKTKGAPTWILVSGAIVLFGLVPLRLFWQSDPLDWLPALAFWVVSLLTFLFSFMLFSEIDIKRQLSVDYHSNRKSSRRLSVAFVIFGFLVTCFQIYFLAEIMARLLNVQT